MKVTAVLVLLFNLVPGPGLLCEITLRHLSNEQIPIKEKELRNEAQQKIDSQLLIAIEQMRGRSSATPTEEVKLRRDAKNRVLVDIRVAVSKKILATLKSRGAKVISTSSRDHSIVAYVGLNTIESLAELTEVKFIMPAAEAVTN
jgi:hypothetical protein